MLTVNASVLVTNPLLPTTADWIFGSGCLLAAVLFVWAVVSWCRLLKDPLPGMGWSLLGIILVPVLGSVAWLILARRYRRLRPHSP